MYGNNMSKTIMIVDDEEDIQDLVSAILEPEGFDMVTASDGNECLDKLKTVTPDLILLDMMMPGISGRETCEKIRANPKTKASYTRNCEPPNDSN